MLASFAMRWRICNGLVLRQTVNAHVKEAAHLQTQNGEQDYQRYFHGCLLWTYYRLEVNTWLVLLPGVASLILWAPFPLSLRGGEATEAISLESKWLPVLDRLPAQKRIGHSIDDIPDIGRVAHASIGDCGYVPACT